MSAPSPLVHYVYVNDPPGCQPAIVTSGATEFPRPADLTVFMANGIQYRRNIGYDSAGYVPGTWHRLSDHEPAEQLRETESSSEQLEDLALAIVVNAWNHATELSVLQDKICELVGAARDSAPRNVLPG